MSITLAQKGDTVTKEFQVKRADHYELNEDLS